MKVAELTAFVASLRKAIKHVSHTRTETDNVIVRCTLDDGTVGWLGQACRMMPSPEKRPDKRLGILKRSDLPAVFAVPLPAS